MPICTYLSDYDCKQSTTDGELNDLLRWVRDATGHDWRIRESTHEVSRGWFRRRKTVKLYTLYQQVFSVEFQIVNFYCPSNSENSINTMVDASLVAAYLYGVLAGSPSQPGDR